VENAYLDARGFTFIASQELGDHNGHTMLKFKVHYGMCISDLK